MATGAKTEVLTALKGIEEALAPIGAASLSVIEQAALIALQDLMNNLVSKVTAAAGPTTT